MSAHGLLAAALRAVAAPRRPVGRIARRLRGVAVRALVPSLLDGEHLSEALDALATPRERGTTGAPLEAHRVVEALGGWRLTCLQRAVAAYAILRPQADDVRLVLGVRPDAPTGLLAHAWIERGGEAVGESPNVRTRYVVAYEHPPRTPRPTHTPEPCVNAGSPSKDVLLTELGDGTGVLLHLKTKFYYTLNRTGVAAWKLLASGEADTAEELASAIAEAFEGASRADVLVDVEALLVDLTAEGLVSR